MEGVELINFTELSLDTKKMILGWRNHPNVKKWMYYQNNISLDEHLSFIESLKVKDDSKYFLLKKKGEYIGVIDFTSINYRKKEAEIGLYSNPELKGNGKIILECIIDYGINYLMVERLFANLFIENKIAYSLYKKLNFKEYKRDDKFIYMEFINENR